MVDIPTGWLALATAIVTSLGTGLAVFFANRQKEIDKRDVIIKELKAQVDAMREARIQALQDQLSKRG